MNKSSRVLGILAGTVILASVTLVSVFALVTFANLAADTDATNYRKLANCTQLTEQMNKQEIYPYFNDAVLEAPTAVDRAESGAGGYSSTNIQVAGVDEADIIKTDGEYIYVATSSDIYLLQATATGLDEPLAVIEMSDIGTPRGLFIAGDKLVVFVDSYGYGDLTAVVEEVDSMSLPGGTYRSTTLVGVYDISSVQEPRLIRRTVIEGNYQTSRMIDGRLYLVGNYYPNYYQEVTIAEVEELIPRISDSVVQDGGLKQSEFVQMAGCSDIAMFGTEGRTFVTVVTFDLADDTSLGTQVLIGNAQTVYMSADNLILATTDYDSEPVEPALIQCRSVGLCPDVLPQSDPRTLLFRLAVTESGVEFAASGTVPGTLLNQFSVDEHNGYLRVVTTVEDWGVRQDLSVNNLYILDDGLSQVGAVEDLAQGERVYSARFIGDRAYLVTFRTIDPLFVIDLTSPANPKVLGQLKIPGYSDYLHPYDENHIIGFGKDTEETATGGAVTLGLKVALFDVTDPTNPVELSKITFGGRYSESNLLYDHRALLFDREKDLMVIPATLYPEETDRFNYTQPEFSGFIAMSIDLEDGISQEAMIPAYKSGQEEYYYYYTYNQRSLFVGDTLFTWDGRAITASRLSDFVQLAQLVLEENDYGNVIY